MYLFKHATQRAGWADFGIVSWFSNGGMQEPGWHVDLGQVLAPFTCSTIKNIVILRRSSKLKWCKQLPAIKEDW
jgi:hypothetical protein